MLDFEQITLVQPAVLVTIITESVLKDSLITLLKNLKVRNYAINKVEGKGRQVRQLEEADSDGETRVETQIETHVDTNIEIKAVVSKELSDVIFYALRDHRDSFTIIAYRQQVETLSD